MRAIGGSVALHALLGVWFLSPAAPVDIMPQQMIVVTLVASAAPGISEPKPEAAAPTPATEKPAARKEPAQLPQKAEPQRSAQEFAALSPAAGSGSAAKASAQMVTTTPQFDAAYLRNPAPDYPAQARRRAMEGSVMLSVVVREDGSAKTVTVEESSGFALLDASARDAVSRWKFIPAKRGDETVEAQVMVPIEFRLE